MNKHRSRAGARKILSQAHTPFPAATQSASHVPLRGRQDVIGVDLRPPQPYPPSSPQDPQDLPPAAGCLPSWLHRCSLAPPWPRAESFLLEFCVYVRAVEWDKGWGRVGSGREALRSRNVRFRQKCNPRKVQSYCQELVRRGKKFWDPRKDARGRASKPFPKDKARASASPAQGVALPSWHGAELLPS